MIRIGIDIGGTFTDFAVWKGDVGGYTSIESFKVLSTPSNYADAVVQGIERIIDTGLIDPREPVALVHGTTVSTNAVIERLGPRIALFTTDGFIDLLNIQRLRLQDPTNLFSGRVQPLIPREDVFEIDERLGADGRVDRSLDREQVARATRQAKTRGVDGVVVCFLHSYRNPEHELLAREIIQATEPGLDVTLSSEVWPEQGEYERCVISTLNGFVKRRMDSYIGKLEQYVAERLPRARLFITKSNGGAMSAAEARAFPAHTLLSGPASGVTAACYLGGMLSLPDILTMDMGGTSTDLSLIRDARPTVSNEAEVGDFPLMMPVTSIEAIGAGGGSIAAFQGAVLSVGPESAGSRPGPACYGNGGRKPTLSDAYLLCGYLDAQAFLGGRMPLRSDLAAEAMRPIAERLGVGIEAASEACIRVATSNMVARTLPYLAGHGVAARDLTLVAYGGAGAIHGPLLAEEIGVNMVLVPRLPSVFCAFGGLVSSLVYDSVQVLRGSEMDGPLLREAFKTLADETLQWLHRQTPSEWLSGHALQYFAEMRYQGQSFEIPVLLDEGTVQSGDLARFAARFHQEHHRLYSHSDEAAAVEYVKARVRVIGSIISPRPNPMSVRGGAHDALAGTRAIYMHGNHYPAVNVYDRGKLLPGSTLDGPAVIEQGDATILVPLSFKAEVNTFGDLILERSH